MAPDIGVWQPGGGAARSSSLEWQMGPGCNRHIAIIINLGLLLSVTACFPVTLRRNRDG